MVRSPRTIADYDALFDPIRRRRQEEPPAHLLLGSDALQLVRAKLEALEQELQEWEALTVSTDG